MTEGVDIDAVIVGAGFAGLYAIHRLRGLGLSVRAFEAGSGVGGTWYWNRYPGARVDVESLYYSYSFDPELEREWEWTERYPTQPEIERYLNHVADRFDLRRDIRLDTRVTGADYDEATDAWTVTTDRGDAVVARFCVMATGCLSAPKRPADIPGVERFGSELYYTSSWPTDGVSFAGKRVGVIGTGSSGVQTIPEVAREAERLHVFQRTANFSSPAHNRPLRPGEQDEIKARYPELRELARHSRNGLPVRDDAPSALATAPEERRRRYEDDWAVGGPTAVLGTFNDIMLEPEANATAADFFRSKIRETVADPVVAEALCPTAHPLGAKRLTVDTGYYATFNRDNVELVDLRREPIEAITDAGVRTSERTYELDVLILATGFDAMTGSFTAIEIRGRDGETLAGTWAEGPRTYLGIQSAGFPNLFLITAPGSPSVLSNMVTSIEQHVDWVADLIASMRAHGQRAVEPDPAAQDAWVAHVNELAAATLFLRADSWYLGANVPGKPRIFMPYVGGVGAYRDRCDAVAQAGYEGFVLTADPDVAREGGTHVDR